jgi:AraC-like DNA-binding protein
MTSKTIVEKAERFRTRLEKRTITLREVASTLACNESYLSRLFSPTLNRVESSSELRKQASEVKEYRTKLREKHALLAANRQKTLRKAAADARCSERTMRRYIAKVKSGFGDME